MQAYGRAERLVTFVVNVRTQATLLDCMSVIARYNEIATYKPIRCKTVHVWGLVYTIIHDEVHGQRPDCALGASGLVGGQHSPRVLTFVWRESFAFVDDEE